MKIPDLVIGGMLMFWGAFALVRYRTRRDKVVGLTYNQFMWGCVIMIVCGALVAFLQFFTDTGHF